MFDQKFQETLSDALQTLQDALSLRREGQDAVNAITDKAGRGDSVEVGKDDTASPAASASSSNTLSRTASRGCTGATGSADTGQFMPR
jgi:hypothetical protein